MSQATSLSSESILKSRALRKEVASIIDHTDRMQQAAHASVNEGLTRKIAQTVTLTVSFKIIGYLINNYFVVAFQGTLGGQFWGNQVSCPALTEALQCTAKSLGILVGE